LIVPLLCIKYLVWNPINLLIGNYNLSDKSNLLIELGHLWYLAVLFVIPVGMYVLLILDTNIKTTRLRQVFYIAVVFMSILISSAADILPSFGKSMIVSLYRYQFFFLVGYIVQKKNILEHTSKTWVFVLFLIAHLLLFGYSLSLDDYGNIYRNLLGLFGSGFWLCLCQGISKCRGKVDAVLNFIDIYSMGIYLFHLPIIYLLLGTTKVSNMPTIALILVLFIVGLVGSVFITFLLRKIKLQKLIGEK
jgi:surface polysaccharide O-acyltransferase-like enzyme